MTSQATVMLFAAAARVISCFFSVFLSLPPGLNNLGNWRKQTVAVCWSLFTPLCDAGFPCV